MRSPPIRSVAILLLAALLVPALAAGQCPEPSALDLRPGADPLLVTRTPGGGLAFGWEEAGAETYWLHAGSLAALAEGRWDHTGLASTPAAFLEAAVPAGSLYFLVHGLCGSEASSAGRTAEGEERPVARRLQVDVAVTGGEAIFGVRADLALPSAMAPVAVEAHPLGPYRFEGPTSLGSGLRLVAAGLPDLERASALVTFAVFEPDLSFAATIPRSVLRFEVQHLGPPPDPAEITLAACEVRRADTEPVPDALCEIVGVRGREPGL